MQGYGDRGNRNAYACLGIQNKWQESVYKTGRFFCVLALFFDKDKHKLQKIVIHDVDLSNYVEDLTIHDVDLTIIDADSTPAYAFHVL